MTKRENILRAVRFENPETIPLTCAISQACWHSYPQDALQDIIEEHPILFPNFKRSTEPIRPKYPPWQDSSGPFTDSWGCVWQTSIDGLTGVVFKHPLEDWSSFENYEPPSPEHQDGSLPIDWSEVRKRIARTKEQGGLATGSLRHGHTFLLLTYLRGYENVIFDMADENPNLLKLIDMIEQFNLGVVQRYIDAGVEWMGYPEDLGMQLGPMLSPRHFRKYIKPVFTRVMKPARDAGCIVHMHSDGDIRDLAEDLVEGGVEILNLQDLVNGIDWIAENFKDRTCIDLDIDRQNVTRFGTPEQIDAHIREAVVKLGGKKGGLMLKHGVYPGIPLENINAVMTAMEKYSQHYS